jgi:hypothetical protein
MIRQEGMLEREKERRKERTGTEKEGIRRKEAAINGKKGKK